MSKWRQDLRNAASGMGLLILVLVAAMIATIWTGDPERPRRLFGYQELAFFPLVATLTVMLCQREFGGSAMELYATYPLSLGAMLLRKAGTALGLSVLLHALVIANYAAFFGKLRIEFYFYSGGPPIEMEVTWLQLLLQVLPAYVAIIAFVLFALAIAKKLYAGLLAGLGLWMLEVLSKGGILHDYTLFTYYLPPGASFAMNRTLWIAASASLLTAACWLVNRRERWVLQQEPE